MFFQHVQYFDIVMETILGFIFNFQFDPLEMN
jgi:hypothetical protein